MRRAFTYVLLALGGFLIIVAVLAQSYIPNQLLKTPLDVDQTTRLAGTAEMIGANGLEQFDVRITNHTMTDAKASTEDDVAWVQVSCVVADAPGVPDCVSADDPAFRLVNASVTSFATTRDSALGIDQGDVLQGPIEPTEGVVNKFPFNTEKKDYPYWDDGIGATVPAVYDRTETLRGVKTYVFKVNVPETSIEVTEGLEGLYSATAEIYVEPLTGSVQNQIIHQERSLPDHTTLFNLDAEFTEAQIAASAKAADQNVAHLNLILHTVPLAGYLAGGLALIAGLVLSLRTRRRN